MKCTVCKLSKPEEDFYWQYKSKGIRSKNCKKCSNHFTKKWYWNNRERCLQKKKEWSKKRKLAIKQYLYEYMSKHPCIACKENDPVVLEFHHKNKQEKEYTVANMAISSFNLERIKKEVAKCEVLCANCHRRQTAKDENWFRFTAAGSLQ